MAALQVRVVKKQPEADGMHDLIAEGDTVTISEPRNHFALVEAPRTLLFAGGIGVTPLLCMARYLAASGADFELHYCTRTKSRAAFLGEIATSALAAQTHLHFDDDEPAAKMDLVTVLGKPDVRTHVYICGPRGFMDHVVGTATRHGWQPSQIHTEYFAAVPSDAASDRAFDVRIASSGMTYCVPAGQTLLQVLAAQGIEILTSCEQGVCGTCITGVLEGVCDHRDLFLTDEEKARNDRLTPCCSRAASPLLVLDL